MKKNNTPLISAIVIILIFLAYALSLCLFTPPEAVSQKAPPTEFSAERAMRHVEKISRKPHPMGTEEHRYVRNYIVSESKKLGLHTEIQTASVFQLYRGLLGGKVHNVLATLKGSEPNKRKPVLIVAHYDSQPHTPGAADDSAAVAAMLESARALKQSPLKNDIIFLFTDGEECGMLGAKAFVDEHPAAKNIGVVLNLEARGNKGTSVTFELSPQNGRLMQEYTKAVKYPFAASIMYEIYKLMPNNSDFTIFRNAGMPGFNAAFIEGYVNYHNMTDFPENLDQRSLQHHGSYIMGIARHFGNLNLENMKKDDRTFFNPIGSWMVQYPGWMNLPLVILTILLFFFYIAAGIKKERLFWTGSIGSIFLYLGCLAVTGLVVWLLQSALHSLYPHYSHFYSFNFYNVTYYFVAVSAVAVMLFSLLYFFFFTKLNQEDLSAGMLTVGMIVLALIYIYMQTAVYIIIFPLMLVLIGNIICFFGGFSQKNKRTLYVFIQLAAVLPVVLMYAPMVKMFYVAFGLALTMGGALFFTLLLGFLIPQLKVAFDINKFALPAAALLVAIIAFVGGHVTSGYDENQPLQSNVMYFTDVDSQKAYWVSKYSDLDEWNSQFFTNPRKDALPELYPYDNRVRLINDTPFKAFPVPVMTVQQDTVENGIRKLSLNVTSARGGHIMDLLIKKEAAALPGASEPANNTIKKDAISKLIFDGKPFTTEEVSKKAGRGKKVDQSKHYIVSYDGLSPEGIDVTIECREDFTVEIICLERKWGLPDFPGIKPFPPNIVPDTDSLSNVSMLRKKFILQPQPKENEPEKQKIED
ncbi:MAG: M20/M25/M40 family metallo-hydrolase [bacterium]|nr:M20/M25/M40 family metallo-hydrolase [bacterium]